MPSFKDSQGNEYDVRLTVKSWRFVKEKTGVDLAGDFQKSMLTIHSDIAAFTNVLYHLVRDQTDGDEEAFFDRLNGDSLEAAREAVVDAVIDFFPNQNQRATAKELVTKANVLEGHLTRKARVVMDEKAKRFRDQIDSTSGESLSKLLEDLGLPPGDSPSAN
jgi:hypothetical protein